MRIIHLIFFVGIMPFAFSQNINYVESAFTNIRSGNSEQAVEQLKKGAASNEILSQYYLACCYEHGIGIEKNLEGAFVYYRRAAERGFSPAMYQLARFYEKGIFVSINEAKSKEWMNKALKRQQHADLPDIILAYLEGQHSEPDSGSSQQLARTETKVDSEVQPQSPKIATVGTPQNSVYTPNTIEIGRGQQSATPKGTSDVDIDIPSTNILQENTFALVIANENYQDIAKVDNAREDGIVFAKYLQQTLGIPEKQIHLVHDATLNNIRRELSYLNQISSAYNGEASFIIYYAGHGIPDEKTKKAYLMPVDAWGGDVATCLSLDDFYAALNDLSAQKVLVFMDACFSGATRTEDMLYAARGVKIKPKTSVPKGNCVVVSSSQGDETAYSHPEQNHGLFTYYLLKKIKESNGNITLGELIDYVKTKVSKSSLILNGKIQTPSVIHSSELGENWRDWSIN